VIECHRGHFDGQEVINLMFDLDHRYRIIDFKIEKEAHARGLRGTLDREQSLRGRYLSITYLPRDTHTSKVDRIRYGLGYWFRAGIIRFPDDLVVRDALTDEVLRFPKWKHDDILDTLVDQTQNQNMTEPDIMAIPKDQPIEVFKLPRFTGFDINGQPTWGGKSDQTMEQFYDPTTGI
jgi:phage terminase large subunit-like protein